MLGNHELGTSFQISSRFEDLGAAVMYINRSRRWNWGIIGEQTPYTSAGFSEQLAVINNQLVIEQQELRFTQINQGVSGIIQYPFNRAHRVELTGGVRRISFKPRFDTLIYDAQTGYLIEE